MLNSTASDAQSRAQKSAQWSARGDRPWCTCTACSSNGCWPRNATKACSSATESSPPESASTRCAWGETWRARLSATAATTGLFGRGFLEGAIRPQALITRSQQRIGRLLAQFGQSVGECAAHRLEHGVPVALRTAQRLLDDAVDQAVGLQAVGGDAQGFGGDRSLVGTLPQDRGATLGGDHRIGRVLQDQRSVADADRQRTARAPLADDGANDRRLQLGHHVEVARDRLGLAALLGADARVSARGVDQGNDGQTELFRQTIEA